MYPYHMNQVPYAPMNYPPFQPHMKPEPVRSAASYEPWQWDGSYGYQYPGQCHSCCNHSYFPGNYFTMRPPYSHVPPPVAHGCPSVPGAYPVQYVPPPHYMMELPRYEYNNMPTDHHCCGCLNHKCNQKDGRNVRIVEEEPDRVDPYEFKNYPYPIVWLPPGYGKAKEEKMDSDREGCDKSSFRGAKVRENSKASEEQPNAWNGGWFPFGANNLRLMDSDHKERDTSSPRGGKVHEDSKVYEEQKNPWNGEWLPFDVKNLQSLKEGEDHKRSQHDQDEKRSRFPFPLFWMPYKPEATENEEPKEKVFKQEPPKNLESAPVKLDNIEAKQEGKNSDESTKMPDKKVVLKTIPVKQVEQNEEKKTSVDVKEKNDGKKSVEDNAPRKASKKLPPVCLRIDPLPKKKGSNGNSRSPSPPVDKRRSHDESGKISEPTVSSTVKGDAKSETLATKNSKDGTVKEVEQTKSNVKSIQVSEGKTPESFKVGHEDQAGNDMKEGTTEVKSSDAGEKSEPKENLASDEERFRRMKLSDEEAAVIIQSAFRGFEVRKWEPLKKLKQLDEIRKQMGEIKNRIQALESSIDTSINDKQRIYIAEMIMSLLLKLDTIQGVHPSIREIRKSLAKELVGLQERLDLLGSKNMKECVEQPSSTSSEENLSKAMKEKSATDGQNREDSIGTARETESSSPESCQNQPLRVEDADSNSEDVEISESVTVNGDEETKKDSGNSSEPESKQTVEIEDNNKEFVDSSVTEAPEDEIEQGFESQQVGGETVSTFEMVDSKSTCVAKDAEKLAAEVAQGALDGNLDSEISIELEKIESRNDEVDEHIRVAPEIDEVKDLNRAELLHEEGQKEQAVSNVEDDLGGDEQQKPDSEVLVKVSPAEVLGEDTKVPPEKAIEGSEAAVPDLNNEVEVCNDEGPPAIVPEALGELSHVSDKMQDEKHDHGVADPNPLFGSEVTEALPTAHEPAVELSKEETVEAEKNNLEEGHDDHHTEETVPLNAIPVEEGDNETADTKMATQSCGSVAEIESIDKSPTRREDVDIAPPSPAASEISCASTMTDSDRKLMEENEKLREMMEKLLEAGNKQLNTISSLSGKVKDLEKKLSRKRKLKIGRSRIPASGSSCLKSRNYSSEERAVGLAM